VREGLIAWLGEQKGFRDAEWHTCVLETNSQIENWCKGLEKVSELPRESVDGEVLKVYGPLALAQTLVSPFAAERLFYKAEMAATMETLLVAVVGGKNGMLANLYAQSKKDRGFGVKEEWQILRWLVKREMWWTLEGVMERIKVDGRQLYEVVREAELEINKRKDSKMNEVLEVLVDFWM